MNPKYITCAFFFLQLYSLTITSSVYNHNSYMSSIFLALTGTYDTLSPSLTPSSWADDFFTTLLFITRFLNIPFLPCLSLLYCYLKFCSFFVFTYYLFLLIRIFSIRPESRLFIALFPVMAVPKLQEKGSSEYFLNEKR